MFSSQALLILALQLKRESTWQHPLMTYYQGAVFMASSGNSAVSQAEMTKPCTESEVRSLKLPLFPGEELLTVQCVKQSSTHAASLNYTKLPCEAADSSSH